MLLLARRNLVSERVRLGISVGGVALAVLLITTLLSLYRGWESKVDAFVEHSRPQVWIASEGTTDFLSAASIRHRHARPPDTRDRLAHRLARGRLTDL